MPKIISHVINCSIYTFPIKVINDLLYQKGNSSKELFTHVGKNNIIHVWVIIRTTFEYFNLIIVRPKEEICQVQKHIITLVVFFFITLFLLFVYFSQTF